MLCMKLKARPFYVSKKPEKKKKKKHAVNCYISKRQTK